MATYRVERTKDYTVMSNCHLRDTSLTLKAKGLLSMMLSLPDEWNYTTRGLAAICKEGVDAIGKALKELENAGYIVRRQLRGAGGKISDTEYVIYEQPQQRPQPDTDNPDTGIPDTDLPDTENPYLDKPDTVKPDTVQPDTENRAELNKDISSKEKTSTDLSITHSFPPSRASAPVEGRTEVSEKRERIREQIDYGLVVTPANREQVNEFVEIMLEVALTCSPTVKIGRDAEYPTAFVQQRFEQLNSEHIRKVLDGIAENTTRVKNTRAYILAALFNAPSTIDNHYTMLVNHDLST